MAGNNDIIQKTVEFVKQTLQDDSSGHDWWHIERVWNNAKYIARKENADMLVVELGALLHDIADWKFHGGTTEKGGQVARAWLKKAKVDSRITEAVVHIVKNVSYKGAGVSSQMKSLEGKVVQDADRLDAIGAIGIARCFTYGGYSKAPIYNPNEKPTMHETFEDYKKNQTSSITHFYEKLLLLKEKMNTKTGKKIAKKRHVFMEAYLNEFLAEWNGDDVK